MAQSLIIYIYPEKKSSRLNFFNNEESHGEFMASGLVGVDC